MMFIKVEEIYVNMCLQRVNTKTKDLLSLFPVKVNIDGDLRSRIKRILTLGDVKSTIAENRLKAFV